MTAPSVAIIGGGLSGLASALFVRDDRRFGEVAIFEGTSAVGGVIRSHVEDGFLFEEGAESMSRVRPAAVALCNRLGVPLMPARISPSATQVVIDGKLVALPSGLEIMAASSYWPLVASPLLKWADRWDEAQGEAAADPVPSDVTARLSQLFAAPVGGMGAVVDALQEELTDVSIRTDAPVSLLRPEDGKWLVGAAGIVPSHYDAVIVALPVPAAAVLSAQVDPGLAAELGEVRSHSVVSVNVAWRREDVPEHLHECPGFLVPEREGKLISYCAFSSSAWRGRSDSAHITLRVLARGDGSLLALPDEELFGAIWAELQDLLGITAEPRLRHLVRHPWALPDFDIQHAPRLGRIEDRLVRLRGLALGGSLWRGPGMSNVIESATRAVRKITGDLEPWPDPV
ncbi:MAG: NAD(P)-binding protein [Proteobacteria bacterium]|nr:NAD(P)-binding protein [Pseudomonadota bacterium]